jgi:hypothetical protein
MRNELRWMIFAASAWLGLSGCASTSESSPSPVASNGATLVNYGSILRPRCENADMQVINGQREAVCRAYLASIDGNRGKLSSRFSNETRVEPGPHHLTILCNYAIIGPNDRGAVPQMTSATAYDGTFNAANRYYVRAEMSDDKCKVWVSETAAGPPAPL